MIGLEYSTLHSSFLLSSNVKKWLKSESAAHVLKCRMDTSTPVPKCPHNSDHLDGTKVSWVRSV